MRPLLDAYAKTHSPASCNRLKAAPSSVFRNANREGCGRATLPVSSPTASSPRAWSDGCRPISAPACWLPVRRQAGPGSRRWCCWAQDAALARLGRCDGAPHPAPPAPSADARARSLAARSASRLSRQRPGPALSPRHLLTPQLTPKPQPPRVVSQLRQGGRDTHRRIVQEADCPIRLTHHLKPPQPCRGHYLNRKTRGPTRPSRDRPQQGSPGAEHPPA